MSEEKNTHQQEENSLMRSVDRQAAVDATVNLGVSILKTTILTVLVLVTLFVALLLSRSLYQDYFYIPEEIAVPSVQGKLLREAVELLEKEGLRVEIKESRYKKDMAADLVLSQEPSAGRKVRKARAIQLVVSLGPELVKVPKLVGLTQREAAIELSNSGFHLGEIKYSKQVYGEPEQVLEQSPSAQELLQKGAKIDLVIQRGSGTGQVVVPAWQGKYYYGLEQQMKNQTLNLYSVTWTPSRIAPAGVVVEQMPEAGKETAVFSPVELEVSTGSESRFRQRMVQIEVPQGNRAQRVNVVLNSPVGSDTVFDGASLPGDDLALMVAGIPGSDIEIYINDQLQRREKL